MRFKLRECPVCHEMFRCKFFKHLASHGLTAADYYIQRDNLSEHPNCPVCGNLCTIDMRDDGFNLTCGSKKCYHKVNKILGKKHNLSTYREDKSRPTEIYIGLCSNLNKIKIGISCNLFERIKRLQLSYNIYFDKLWIFPTTYESAFDFEKHLHEKYQKYKEPLLNINSVNCASLGYTEYYKDEILDDVIKDLKEEFSICYDRAEFLKRLNRNDNLELINPKNVIRKH